MESQLSSFVCMEPYRRQWVMVWLQSGSLRVMAKRSPQEAKMHVLGAAQDIGGS